MSDLVNASPVRTRRMLRQRKLDALGYADYNEYLRSSHWLRVRHAYRLSDQPQECICGCVDRLQLHHMTYERVGAEELSDLTVLCPECHRMIHVLERRGEIGLDFTGFINEKRAERYAHEQSGLVQRRQADHADPAIREAHDRQAMRSHMGRLREVSIAALKQGHDPLPVLADAIDAIDELSNDDPR